MAIYNTLKNTRIEFHILQSFPVTCLNRDDVGSPKTAMVGGTQRARVSSQAWKRPVRMMMHEMGGMYGTRTKLIGKLIADACMEQGATTEQAMLCGNKIESAFIKKTAKKATKGDNSASETPAEEEDEVEGNGKADTLLFLSPNEVRILAKAFAAQQFEPNKVFLKDDPKKLAGEIANLIGDFHEPIDAVDIALFGRMVAQAPSMSVEGAVAFSHAISTHKVSNEVEFFTGLDDLVTDTGAAHLGSLEFNSATYYRYVSLDLGQLAQTLGGQHVPEAVENFTKALFMAIPAARQATQSGASPWNFAKILVRKGQRLQVPFEAAVPSKNGSGFLKPSIEVLKDYLDTQEKLYGSLFGKVAGYTFGEDPSFSIDDLILALKGHAATVGGVQHV